MVICKNCGVALDDEMLNCPLCGSPVHSQATNSSEKWESGLVEGTFFSPYSSQKSKVRRRKITWEVVSIVLLSIGIATSTINWLINKQISWSEYPVSVCLIVFSYISVFA
ncbi:MAG: hypothetical protein M3142_12335, partial [Bacteroidota bacterium]|nr:hypothetical protein [Bacteroidota bacterium]